MGTNRNSLLSEEQCVEPPRDSGGADINQSAALQVNHPQWRQVQREHHPSARYHQLERSDDQLPARWQQDNDGLLYLARPFEFQLLVEPPLLVASEHKTVSGHILFSCP